MEALSQTFVVVCAIWWLLTGNKNDQYWRRCIRVASLGLLWVQLVDAVM